MAKTRGLRRLCGRIATISCITWRSALIVTPKSTNKVGFPFGCPEQSGDRAWSTFCSRNTFMRKIILAAGAALALAACSQEKADDAAAAASDAATAAASDAAVATDAATAAATDAAAAGTEAAAAGSEAAAAASDAAKKM
jgi:hypothetical protein